MGQRGMQGHPGAWGRRVAVLGCGLSLTGCEGESESYWQVRKSGLGEADGFTRSQENGQDFNLDLRKLQSLQSSQDTLRLRIGICSSVKADRNRGQSRHVNRGVKLAVSVPALEAKGARGEPHSPRRFTGGSTPCQTSSSLGAELKAQYHPHKIGHFINQFHREQGSSSCSPAVS